MIESVGDWLVFLRRSDPLIGVPFLLGGTALMVFGWRMWRLCVVLSFGLIGVAAAPVLFNPSDDRWFYALVGGALLALVSYWLAKYAVSILGGLIGAGIIAYLLADMKVTGAPLWLTLAIVFIIASAVSFLNRRHVVIGVTAVLGAVLGISGLTAFLMASPNLYGTFSSLAGTSAIVLPFILLVPAVMSYFYQVAEVHRFHAEL